jgi:serine protein kinase
MSVVSRFKEKFTTKLNEKMSMDDFLDRCKADATQYANAHERMLLAFGKPNVVRTSEDEALGRIFANREIRVWEPFKDFYGIESVIEKLYSYFKHGAQGLEEAKQILYLLGPVGAAKSSLAERLKFLMEQQPFYTIEATNGITGKTELSPFFESPLGIFDYTEYGNTFEADYKIPRRYLKHVMSPWAAKRLQEARGDLDAFKVVKVWPSILNQVGVTKVEPGDENNQDITSLVGKVSIRKIGQFDETDIDAYSSNGGLNVSTQGMMEFVEMFKAPIKMLHPLLTATQEGHYNGTQPFGAIPFQGVILAHSNESEWKSFRNDKKNEAFLDRVCVVNVPYCLRWSEEVKIYQKLIAHSELRDAKCAPGTLEMLAQWSVLSRMKVPENSNSFLKMEVYDGKNMKNKYSNVKSMDEYRTHAGIMEGMSGSSTRFAHKTLSQVFNFNGDEISANPIHLMMVLEDRIKQEQLPEDEEKLRLTFIAELKSKYLEFLQNELQEAYIDDHDAYCQNLYERYIQYADDWMQDKDFRDPSTGMLMDRAQLNEELEKIEKAAGIANPKEFRSEVVGFSLRYKANNGGKMPKWNAYEKIKEVIEKKVFTNLEELLPVIAFGKKSNADDEKKHNSFVERMKARGYTLKMIQLCVEYFIRSIKHS